MLWPLLLLHLAAAVAALLSVWHKRPAMPFWMVRKTRKHEQRETVGDGKHDHVIAWQSQR